MSLTEADKRWLENQFGYATEELRQVRSDLRQARGEIGSAYGEIEPVRSQLARFETNVVTTFRNLASSAEAWHNAHCTKLGALELEVHALQDRVAKLESAENA